ncbi:hypothetical protein OHA40_02960 [Nocardia sp. NBC_00508]|uniref:hypothetical protein n=1 Tax=Nocardia sp. NBC_00508 TaxID=2975992 RepID=UPI002E8009E0|nr:hypothetical protein [Nocardia sp. NBC_00508]WUD67136.1 hypothetical protein OHA40_02960 [Nocardia sp. NBC_00508]
MLYGVIAAIVITLLAAAAAAMVWDPRRREFDEYDLDVDEMGVMSEEYARQGSVEWPRKEMSERW